MSNLSSENLAVAGKVHVRVINGAAVSMSAFVVSH